VAAAALQQELRRMVLTEGKMFGVLVVEAPHEGAPQLGFVAAYSGILEGRNDWPYFVPPVYDAQSPEGHFKQEEQRISAMNDEGLREERRKRSQELQRWLFEQYRFLNGHGEVKDLVRVWQDYHSSPRLRKKFPLPPGGTGDCCAPKLLQYAYSHGLKPVCMAEFWWGPPPSAGKLLTGDDESGLVRHHGQFYPACRGKCKPVLTWMLQGLDVDPNPEMLQPQSQSDLEIVYEDDYLLIINKPAGMLSVPGRISSSSVATMLHQRFPDSMLVHRLDMCTSGLLVAAKNRSIHAALQKQFADHTVRKRYIALLDQHLAFTGRQPASKGTISLPLSSDPLNRPRQVVDYKHGKTAVTIYEMISENRVALQPLTGRTHQLRMHCAHPDGLGCPIMGDELYGRPADRLYLHAESLEFTHPVTGLRLCFDQPADF